MDMWEIDDLTPPSVRRATSVAAAQSIAESTATLRSRVLAYLKRCGDRGATDEEMQLALGMGGNTQRPRRRELEAVCAIRRAGTTRATLSGRHADVWVATGRPLNSVERSWFQEEV